MTLDAAVSADAQSAVALDVREHHQCCGNDAPGWCVAHTHPQAEHWASSNLNRLGYATYLPLYARRVRDRVLRSLTRVVESPLFPSYLFVQNASPDLWRPIREAPGVHSVLRTGNRIQYARAGAVEALQATEAVRRTLTTPGALWRPGAACKLAYGPFQGQLGVVMDIDGRMRAKVMLMVLGAMRHVSVSVDCLEPRDADQF